MGYYINPEDETKEEFLTRLGERVSVPFYPQNTDKALICLVNNGMFTAAAICYSKEEFEAFNNPRDHRPKTFYIVNKSDLSPFISLEKFR